MERETVLVRMYGDGAQPELGCRPKHADGDLAAVGDEQFAQFAFGDTSPAPRGHVRRPSMTDAACGRRGCYGIRQ